MGHNTPCRGALTPIEPSMWTGSASPRQGKPGPVFWQYIHRLAHSTIVEKIIQQNDYYVALVLPANTYPGQNEDARTLAVTAMFVVNKNIPDERLLKFMMTVEANIGAITSEAATKAYIRPETAKLGISIPWHPAAEEFFAKR